MILRTYILKRLFFLTVISSFLLTGIIWLAQSLRFVELIVTRGIAMGHFLYFIFFLLPDLLILALPIGFLISVLITYHRLSTDHELMVMKSAGCSDVFLINPVVRLGILVGIAVTGLTLYVLPLSFQKFRQLELNLRNSYSSNMLIPGEFIEIGSVTLYAATKDAKGGIGGMFIKDQRVPEKPVVIMAEQGHGFSKGNTLTFMLKRGTRQEMDAKNPPSLLQFDTYALQLKLPSPSAHYQRKPYEMYLWELWNPGFNTSQDNLSKLRSEAHQRILAPFLALSFGLVAVFFLLRTTGYRSSHSRPVLYSILTCTLIQATSMVLLQQQKVDLDTIPFAYLVVMAPFACFIVYVVWIWWMESRRS